MINTEEQSASIEHCVLCVSKWKISLVNEDVQSPYYSTCQHKSLYLQVFSSTGIHKDIYNAGVCLNSFLEL